MNILTKSSLLVLLLMTVALGALAADGDNDKPRTSVTPYIGGTFWDKDMELENDLLYGGRLGLHFFGPLVLEGTYGRTDPDHSVLANQVAIDHFGLDLLLDLLPGKKLNPYLTGGWSQFDYKPDMTGSIRQHLNGWEAGGGVKLRLGGDNATHRSLRLELRDVMTDLDASLTGEGGTAHNLLATVGLEFAFGKCSKDSDLDGVLDKQDVCPDTPAGVMVDDAGCPLDTDGDGVFDGLDKCDATPAGAQVDFSGCPLDCDNDGVYDGLDKCADTPAGAVVDAVGCPLDSDGDGVFDGLDQCADTAANLQVDVHGCPIAVTATEIELLDTGMITTSQIVFKSGSAELDLADTHILDEIGQTLVPWPALQMEIGGHTDSQGSETFNQALSEQRAQAVLDYLSANFPEIAAGQYTVKGYGEAQPVADNDTAEGRALNRRVEFKVLNTETLKKEIESRKLLER